MRAACSKRGQAFAELGEFEQTLRDVDRALELQPVGGTARAYVLSGRALAHAGLGRYAEAERDFEASIEVCPANAWVHYNHGLMDHAPGRTQKAVACFELALQLDEPALTPLKRDRARAYVDAHRPPVTDASV